MTDTPAYRKRATLCAEIVPLMPLLGIHGGILFQALKSVAYRVYCKMFYRHLFCRTVSTKFDEFCVQCRCVQKVQQGCLLVLVQHMLFCSSITTLLPSSFIDTRDPKTVHRVRLKTFWSFSDFCYSLSYSRRSAAFPLLQDLKSMMGMQGPMMTGAPASLRPATLWLKKYSFSVRGPVIWICPRQPFCRRSSENLTVP